MLSAEVGVEHEPASQHWLAEEFLSKKVKPQLLWLSFLQDPYILMHGYDHGKHFTHVYFNLFLNTLKLERETEYLHICKYRFAYVKHLCLMDIHFLVNKSVYKRMASVNHLKLKIIWIK